MGGKNDLINRLKSITSLTYEQAVEIKKILKVEGD